MSDQNSLGGRLPLLSPGSLRPPQKLLYEWINSRMVPWAEENGFRAATTEGQLLGPFNVLLHSPALGQAVMDATAAEQQNTSLKGRVREIVILTVGAVWRAKYELYAHTAVARKQGLDEETIQTLVSGGLPEGLSEEETVAHEFAHALAAEHNIDAKMCRRAEAAFGPKGLIDLIILAGNYITISALLNTFAVPVPPDEPEAATATEGGTDTAEEPPAS